MLGSRDEEDMQARLDIVPDHGYVVDSIDTSGNIYLRNIWNWDNQSLGISILYSDIPNYFHDIYIRNRE